MLFCFLLIEVRQSERNLSKRLYEQEQGFVGQKIAFGRRSEGPPYLHYPARQNVPEIVVPGIFMSYISLLT